MAQAALPAIGGRARYVRHGQDPRSVSGEKHRPQAAAALREIPGSFLTRVFLSSALLFFNRNDVAIHGWPKKVVLFLKIQCKLYKTLSMFFVF